MNWLGETFASVREALVRNDRSRWKRRNAEQQRIPVALQDDRMKAVDELHADAKLKPLQVKLFRVFALLISSHY